MSVSSNAMDDLDDDNDLVLFKVFTHWSEDSKTKPEVRRFGVDRAKLTTFPQLNAKLLQIFPGLKGKIYTVCWKDEDGDDVSLSSDGEIMNALTFNKGELVKLNVYCKNTEPKDDDCDY